MKKHRIKKRYIILLLAILSFNIGFLIYTVNVGQTYELVDVVGYDRFDMDSIKAQTSDSSVLRIRSIDQKLRPGDKMNYISVELESAGSGDCTLDLSYPEPGEETKRINGQFHFRVLPFGVIYNIDQQSFSSVWLIVPLALIMIMLTVVVLTVTFVQKLVRGEFSYSMAGHGGVILFLALLFGTIISNIQSLTGEGVPHSVDDLLFQFTISGNVFLNATNIPMLLLAVALAVSNIWLILKEGFRVQNALGILIGVLLVGSMFVINISNDFNSAENDLEYYSQMIIHTGVTFIAFYLECMLISTVFCAVASTVYRPAKDMDYIIILGCAIRKDGTPTPLLRGRVQRAFDFEKRQFEATGKHAKFVPSGGQGSDEVISEAESMKRCLMELGAPEENILMEDKSVNTYQNMAFSKKLIEQDADNPGNVKIGFSTTNYHVFRGYTLAQKVGMTVKGLSAKTKLYFFPNAFVREFIGLLWEKKLYHLIYATLLVGAMVLFSLLLM